MEVFWFWFFIFLLFISIFALPAWPYTRERGLYARGGYWPYATSGIAFVLAMVVLLFFWLGVIAIAWPWYAVAPT